MEVLQAILLGIIEGLTEFLPISSTGHLIVAQEYIKFHDKAKTFTVVIQSGAILAVVWFYRHELWQKLQGFIRKERKALRFWLNLVVATIPAGVLGLALDKSFERYSTATVVATALIVGGIVLWLVDGKHESSEAEEVAIDKVTSRQAIGIGFAQCIALIPGVSRSGASIVGGMIAGLNRPTATAFSFYLGIPVLGLASIYKLATGWNELGAISGGAISIVLGLIAAFITALLAIGWLLKYVSTHNFRPFAYYRIILGIIILLLLV